jgi:hypothetical protein
MDTSATESSIRLNLAAAVAEKDIVQIIALETKVKQAFPQPARLLVEIGIKLRDLEVFEQADRVFSYINSIERHEIFGHYELAISRMLQGRHIEALFSVLSSLAKRPNDVRSKILCSRLMAATGDIESAYLQLLSVATTEPQHVVSVAEFLKFQSRFPPSQTIELANALRSKAAYLNTQEVANAVLNALTTSVPFSLVRIGDGEGAFLRISNENELEYVNLYARNRRDRAAMWFGSDFDIYASGFFEESRLLGDAVVTADVVGIPYPSWIAHEYKILSITGISTLVNCLRFASSLESCFLAAQNIHSDLMMTGCLDAIVRQAERVTVLSCHKSLPEALKSKFSKSEVKFIQIPPEIGSLQAIGASHPRQLHFPDRYREIVDLLREGKCEGLFLVAGGLLGKIYCKLIKENGGVAIDVGSVADAWVGVKTRPNATNKYQIVPMENQR